MAWIASQDDIIESRRFNRTTVVVGPLAFNILEFTSLQGCGLTPILLDFRKMDIDQIVDFLCESLEKRIPHLPGFAITTLFTISSQEPKYADITIKSLAEAFGDENPHYCDSKAKVIASFFSSGDYSKYADYITEETLLMLVNQVYERIREFQTNKEKMEDYIERFKDKRPNFSPKDPYPDQVKLLEEISGKNEAADNLILARAQENFGRDQLYFKIASNLLQKTPSLATDALAEKISKFGNSALYSSHDCLVKQIKGILAERAKRQSMLAEANKQSALPKDDCTNERIMQAINDLKLKQVHSSKPNGTVNGKNSAGPNAFRIGS